MRVLILLGGVIEETSRSCFSLLFKVLLSYARGIGNERDFDDPFIYFYIRNRNIKVA
jgi:hypothetical protein